VVVVVVHRPQHCVTVKLLKLIDISNSTFEWCSFELYFHLKTMQAHAEQPIGRINLCSHTILVRFNPMIIAVKVGVGTKSNFPFFDVAVLIYEHVIAS
jgi:hypothetical protein